MFCEVGIRLLLRRDAAADSAKLSLSRPEQIAADFPYERLGGPGKAVGSRCLVDWLCARIRWAAAVLAAEACGQNLGMLCSAGGEQRRRGGWLPIPC